MKASEVSNQLTSCAAALASLSPRLEPALAARLHSEVAARIERALIEVPNSQSENPRFKKSAAQLAKTMQHLAEAYAAVSSRLPAEGATASVGRMMAFTTDFGTSWELQEALLLLLTGKGARDLARDAVAGIASAPMRAGALISPAFLAAAQPPECSLPTQKLVDLLKQPLCVGQARRIILDLLEKRYQRSFADQWEFVRFAGERKLGLDFTSPPKRPAEFSVKE
jgi:hypothetical protein